MKIKLPIFSHEILKAERGWIREVANEQDGGEYESWTKIKVFSSFLLK